MMRVLIVDDEAAARRRLHVMLEELDVEVVGDAANGVEALVLTRERNPDVLLLDIAMPEVDGFDVVRHLPEPRPLIIFQTAHDEFALRAFEHEALDYVVKPVALQRLRQALERARKRLDASGLPALPAGLLSRIQSAVASSAGAAAPKLRLLVREDVGHRLVPLADIVRFTAAHGRTEAHVEGARFHTDYTMAELDARTAGRFARTGRADLVNLEQIERFVREADGAAYVTLADGTRLRVSRRRVAEVRDMLD